MKFYGFLETSFLDWDGYISSVLFSSSCSFKCPFCHNPELVNNHESLKEIPLEDIQKFIFSRRDFLDGVVFSGGEPTLHADLPKVIQGFKEYGLKVKLDTNGTNPEMIKRLIKDRLIDHVAMDIKAPLDERYRLAAGIPVGVSIIKNSIDTLMKSNITHEFRTTVCPEYIDEKGVEDIARTITGAERYILQQFAPGHCLDETLHQIKPYSKETLQKMADLAKPHVVNCLLRGA